MARKQKQQPQGWRNRIVGSGTVAASQLLANPSNWRVHPKAQQDALNGALDQIGWIQDVIVNQTSGHIVDGHLRVTLALRQGDDTPVPVKYVELSEADERLALATIDPLSAMAATDKEQLDALLRDVAPDSPAVAEMLADVADKAGLAYGAPASEESEPTELIDRASELQDKWQVKRGDVWQVGRHRLMCGDSTSTDEVARLMNGATPDVVIADPPYGVSIVATNVSVGGGEAYAIPFGGRKGHVGGGAAHMARTGMTYMESNKRRLGTAGGAKPFGSKQERVRGSDGAANAVDVGKYAPIIGDDTTETAKKSVTALLSAYPKAVHVWWGANYYTDALKPSMCWLVWNKETTGNFADCELAWTNQDRAAKLFTHRWNGMLRDSERERRMHPTQKPAALAEWVYAELSEGGKVVLDPFCGAGWAMVAAERSGRTGYAMELSPDYIAVTLERLSAMGLESKRL